LKVGLLKFKPDRTIKLYQV